MHTRDEERDTGENMKGFPVYRDPPLACPFAIIHIRRSGWLDRSNQSRSIVRFLLRSRELSFPKNFIAGPSTRLGVPLLILVDRATS
jgi:hypothetical protein